MRNNVLSITTAMDFVVEECAECGVPFAMTSEFQRHRHADKQLFYCPSGHTQSYIGRPLREQLRDAQRALANTQEENRIAAAQINQMKADKRRLETRLKAGVCPHCHRTFAQLARHMTSKHAKED